MKKKLLIKAMILASLTTTMVQAKGMSYDNGFYVGISSGIVNFGGDSLLIDNGDKTIYRDIDNSPTEFKVGYQHYLGNRFEIYRKYNELDTNGVDVDIDTYGFNYEFGFETISSGSEFSLPYISIGMGLGEASSDSLKIIDDTQVTDFSIGFGIHYEITKNINASFDYSNHTIVFINKDDKNNDISNVDTNIIKMGLSYHF